MDILATNIGVCSTPEKAALTEDKSELEIIICKLKKKSYCTTRSSTTTTTTSTSTSTTSNTLSTTITTTPVEGAGSTKPVGGAGATTPEVEAGATAISLEKNIIRAVETVIEKIYDAISSSSGRKVRAGNKDCSWFNTRLGDFLVLLAGMDPDNITEQQ